MSLEYFYLKNTESLKNLVHLSSLHFKWSFRIDLSFLKQENNLPELTTLSIEECGSLATSALASLSHASNLRTFKFVAYPFSPADFNNDCLKYLDDMIHLRKLDLSRTKIVGDSRLFNSLMQNLFQLEELYLEGCHRMGNQGAIAGGLYSTHSRLRVLNLSRCDLVDDDLNGIGALKNTLEVLDLSYNRELTTGSIEHCEDLVKLKVLDLWSCVRIGDLSPLKGCLNLEEVNVGSCKGLVEDSFRVFSEEPNSFPNVRVLNIRELRRKVTQKALEHLSKNNHLVYRLKELYMNGMGKILLSSNSARDNLCRLKGLRVLRGIFCRSGSAEENELKTELMKRLTNIDEEIE